MDEILNERAAAARRRFEVPVLVAALLVVPVIYIEAQVTSPAWRQVAVWTNWLIWLAFFAEYVTVLALTDRRWAYTRKAWLDVFIIVTSFPALPAALAATRLLRLTRLTRVLRLVRLTRLAAVVTRGGAAAGTVFHRGGLGYVLMVTVLLALGAAGLFALTEPAENFGDGLWWSVVTLTTVGYGDMVPQTVVGRVAGAGLMLLGIGFVALLTAAVAAKFVGDDETELAAEIRRLHERLDVIQQQLGIVEVGTPDGGPGVPPDQPPG
jgi:voltage-gated potassium channel